VIGKATSLTAVALGLVLAGCASEAGTSTKASYSLGRGTASYDQLRRDSERCAADGGKIEAKQDGGDPTQLANYSCVIPKGGK
jgi:outer membrane murein-binding lipoprotein Lpp